MEELAIRDHSLQAKEIITQELFSRFINYIDGSPKTIQTYTRALRQFFAWIHEEGITEPTRTDILHYRDHLKETCKPNTVQNYIVAVRQFFKWAAQEGIYTNIAENIKGAKIDRSHKKDALTTIQIKDILGTIDTQDIIGTRDYAMLLLMVTGGLRTIEVQRANVEDLRTLGNETVLYIQGKGREEKTDYVKLDPRIEKAIRSYLKARGNQEPGAALFTSHSDRNSLGRLSTKSISRIVKERFVKAGYDSDRLTAHSLRHSAATLNLLNGGTLEETQQLLRHSNINTTMVYAHHLKRANNQSESRISEAIFG